MKIFATSGAFSFLDNGGGDGNDTNDNNDDDGDINNQTNK